MTDDFVTVSVADDFVATVTLCRPPNNFFSAAMIGELADAVESLDEAPSCRAIVLAADGKHFCAGADFASAGPAESTGDL